ncbi:dGTP triphosphohydrolase [uncultured Roseivirga sp.]|uniref:dGTP triphosphohydrolase n=1 Tax=uncultured Roseivirga sp. TaxID=543088 RepID=UPI000D791FFD|nr:dNTP triphosphohydrolase [uncultured Roseivirga sp.]PWL29315.1 MAG: deoxyguanosinetriphosphate triphosphohydrolase [Roseivirga sp. XM-24bin3]
MNIESRWSELLSPLRFRDPSKRPDFDGRNDFEQDYGRLIFSSSIRRLQDKTQVFPLDKSDFIRTRLTHSLEVSSLGRSLGQSAERELERRCSTSKFSGQLSSLLASAGLVHDLGNPPFGHFGETAIQDFFNKELQTVRYESWTDQMKRDYIHFDGNVQTFRILTKLHFFKDKFSYNLSYPTLSSIIKYPRNSINGNQDKLKRKSISDKKYGYFLSEENEYKAIDKELKLKGERHPIVFLLEASDDIAYSIADIEDGVKAGGLDYETILETFNSNLDLNDSTQSELIQSLEEFYTEFKEKDLDHLNLAVQRFRVPAQRILIESVVQEFNNNLEEISRGEYNKELLKAPRANQIRSAFEELAKIVFKNKVIIKREVTGYKVIQGLLNIYIPSCYSDNFNYQSKTLEGRLYKTISSNYRYIYENFKDKSIDEKYSRLQLVVDFISGMTDSYALKLYQELTGIRV